MPSSSPSNNISEPGYEIISSGPRNFPQLRTVNIPLPIYRPTDEFKINPDFQGRNSVFSQIKDALTLEPFSSTSETGPMVKSFAICGPGGIGKTQTARQSAASARDLFNVVFWINAREEHILRRDFLRIAIYLGFEKSGQVTDTVISKEHITSWLSNPRYLDAAGDT